MPKYNMYFIISDISTSLFYKRRCNRFRNSERNLAESINTATAGSDEDSSDSDDSVADPDYVLERDTEGMYYVLFKS